MPKSGRQQLAMLSVDEDHFCLFHPGSYGNPYGGSKQILEDALTWELSRATNGEDSGQWA